MNLIYKFFKSLFNINSSPNEDSIEEFTFISNNSKEIINFKKSELVIDPSWKLIKQDIGESQNWSGGLSQGLGGLANVGLGAYAIKGLYKATTDPSTLMNLGNGTVGSAIMGKNGIIGQAGFSLAGLGLLTPLIVFQALSFVTGQYYMHQINNKLKGIQIKVDQMIKNHKYEREAKLEYALNVIEEFCGRSTFLIEDFVLLKNVQMGISIIKKEYLNRLAGSNVEEVIEKLVGGKRSNSVSKKINEEFLNSEYLQSLEMVVMSDSIFFMLKTVELNMNIKSLQYNEKRSDRILEIKEEFTLIDRTNYSYEHKRAEYEELKSNLYKALKDTKQSAWFKKEEHDKRLVELKNYISKYDEEFDRQVDSIDQNLKYVLQPFRENLEIVIDARGEMPLTYIREHQEN